MSDLPSRLDVCGKAIARHPYIQTGRQHNSEAGRKRTFIIFA
ncbi:MAG TPA: hypothetical protein V6D20_24500 [Candidatus Obscuribacterales bacterium]